MDTLMIFLAKYLYLIVGIIAVLYVLMQSRSQQKKILIFSIIALPLTYLVAKIAGHFYFDPRPFVTHHLKPLIAHAPTNGFPSDHALLSFAIASVIFIFNKKIGIILGVLGLFVGISRIYVMVHSPIDIAGSFMISVCVVGIIWYLSRKIFRIGL